MEGADITLVDGGEVDDEAATPVEEDELRPGCKGCGDLERRAARVNAGLKSL